MFSLLNLVTRGSVTIGLKPAPITAPKNTQAVIDAAPAAPQGASAVKKETS
jgi:hypothetical protein